MAEKVRLDVLLVQKGLAASREKAKELVAAGAVTCNGSIMKKAGILVDANCMPALLFQPFRYVSRGGLKLEKMLEKHHIDLTGNVCIDIGASSGGFTDCMLQKGARKVFAVDVGFGQLAESLCNDPRVINLERTNIRSVTNKEVPEPVDFGSVDVSFISLTLVLPVLFRLMRDNGKAVCLIKPQFEAGKGNVGKKGVVRNPETHIEVLEHICSFCKECGFRIMDLDFSPIKGPEGNIEYLIYLVKTSGPGEIEIHRLKELVALSHQKLK